MRKSGRPGLQAAGRAWPCVWQFHFFINIHFIFINLWPISLFWSPPRELGQLATADLVSRTDTRQGRGKVTRWEGPWCKHVRQHPKREREIADADAIKLHSLVLEGLA